MTHQHTTQSKTSENDRASQASAKAKSAAPAMHPILHLQRQVGNQAVGRLIQAKLTVGEPNDVYEQEADRMAAAVVSQIHAPQNVSTDRTASIQRQAIGNEEEELQAKPLIQGKSDLGGMSVSSEIESSIQQARGSGQPLAESLRTPMEQAFGADFSGVRVHTGAERDRLNRSIQARAFTTGQDVFFRQGAYQPGSRGGQELIAHELTHVVQQNGGAVMRSAPEQREHIQRLIIAQDDSPKPAPLSIEAIQQNIQNLPQEVQTIILEIHETDQYAMTLQQAIKMAIAEASHGELVHEDQGMETESIEEFEERFIGGHGGFEERNLLAKEGTRGKETHYKLPPGVEVVMYAPDGAWLDNPVANAIEIGSPLANDEVVLESNQSPYYRNMPAEYPKTFTAGESIINYTIKPPDNLKIEGEQTILVEQAMLLSAVIEQHKPSSGKTMKFHIAVCAVGGVTSASKYSNLFEGGAGYAVVRREDVLNKKRYQTWLEKN
jgi:Domain of unknown function (DUF4157)